MSCPLAAAASMRNASVEATQVLNMLRQSERHIRSSARLAPSAATRHDNILLSLHLVHGRCRVPAVRQDRLPQQLPCLLIERSELLIVRRAGDEEQPASGHDAATVVLHARVLHALRR